MYQRRPSGRLFFAFFSSELHYYDLFTERAQYDLNGNIVSLSRTSDGATSDLMFYHYAGGRLASVDGLAPATFEHDEAGNMTANGYDDLEIQYNLLNLPSQITDSGAPDDTVTNRYSVAGQKVSSVDGDGNGVLYVGSLVYGVQASQIGLESAPFAGGRFFAVQGATGVKYALQYYVTDHLGSVRVVLDRDGNILERNDYYPFGKRWEDANSPNSTNRYRYNGKELAASRLLDYGARYYSPGLGRWMSIEPLADFFPSQSVYAMCFNNPIRYVDRFGLSPDEPTYYGGEIEGVVCIGYRPDQSMPRYSWDWGGYDEWLEKMYSSFYGVGGGAPGGGGGGGRGSGGGPTNPDGTDTMKKYNDLMKEINGAPGAAIDLANYFTKDEIDWLVKTGRVSTIIGKANIFVDGVLAVDALADGDIRSTIGHAYEAIKGRVAMSVPWGTLAVMGLEVGEAVFEIRKHNILIRQHVPPATLPFTPVGLEIEARNRYINSFWGSFGY